MTDICRKCSKVYDVDTHKVCPGCQEPRPEQAPAAAPEDEKPPIPRELLTNRFLVGSQEGLLFVGNPSRILTRADAFCLAAWLVEMAERDTSPELEPGVKVPAFEYFREAANFHLHTK